MTKRASKGWLVYTRKYSEEGRDQSFNCLHAQREACEADIKSQMGEGLTLVRTLYDDGGISGATMQRPALQRPLADMRVRKDVITVTTALAMALKRRGIETRLIIEGPTLPERILG